VLRGRELCDALAERLVAEDMDVRRRALCRGERKQPAVDGQVNVRVAMNDGREEREDDHGVEQSARTLCPAPGSIALVFPVRCRLVNQRGRTGCQVCSREAVRPDSLVIPVRPRRGSSLIRKFPARSDWAYQYGQVGIRAVNMTADAKCRWHG
jgi:hypothetical protein